VNLNNFDFYRYKTRYFKTSQFFLKVPSPFITTCMTIIYQVYEFQNMSPIGASMIHNIELKFEISEFFDKKLSTYPNISPLRSSKSSLYQLHLNLFKCCANHWRVRMFNLVVVLYTKYITFSVHVKICTVAVGLKP